MVFGPRYRIALLSAVLAAALVPGVCAQPLAVRLDADRLHVSSRLHFLEGKPLARLHNGAPVVYAVQLTLLSGSRGMALARAGGRFAFSFDIWEEKFSVSQLAEPRKAVSHLTASQAENWCLDNLILTNAGLSPDAAFWIRLDVRAEKSGEHTASADEGGMTLTRLVEFFSQPQRDGDARKQVEAGPWKLKDLH